jgi:hypothetical protein
MPSLSDHDLSEPQQVIGPNGFLAQSTAVLFTLLRVSAVMLPGDFGTHCAVILLL